MKQAAMVGVEAVAYILLLLCGTVLPLSYYSCFILSLFICLCPGLDSGFIVHSKGKVLVQ